MSFDSDYGPYRGHPMDPRTDEDRPLTPEEQYQDERDGMAQQLDALTDKEWLALLDNDCISTLRESVSRSVQGCDNKYTVSNLADTGEYMLRKLATKVAA